MAHNPNRTELKTATGRFIASSFEFVVPNPPANNLVVAVLQNGAASAVKLVLRSIEVDSVTTLTYGSGTIPMILRVHRYSGDAGGLNTASKVTKNSSLVSDANVVFRTVNAADKGASANPPVVVITNLNSCLAQIRGPRIFGVLSGEYRDDTFMLDGAGVVIRPGEGLAIAVTAMSALNGSAVITCGAEWWEVPVAESIDVEYLR